MELASKCKHVKKYQWRQQDLNPGQPHEKPTLYHSATLVSCNIGEKILYLFIMRSRGQNNPCSKLKSLYTIILRIWILGSFRHSELVPITWKRWKHVIYGLVHSVWFISNAAIWQLDSLWDEIFNGCCLFGLLWF